MNKKIAIKDIAKVTNGKSDVKDAIDDGKYAFFDRSTITKRSNKYLFNSEAIIIAGEDSRQIFEPRYFSGKFNLHQRCYVIYDFNENYYPKYLLYKLKTLTKHFANVCVGSTVPSLRLDHITDLKIDIPDLPTQKAIAKVLSDLDAKIELNNRINKELEAMAKTLYDYWFVQFDFPDENGKPYKSSGGKMVYNEELKREIPEGWKVGTFGDYSKVKSGFAFKSTWWQDSGIPVLKIKDIQEDYTLNQNDFSFVGEDKIEVANNFKSKAGDVVIAMTGATIGKFAIIPYTDKPILINQRVGLYDLGSEPFNKLPFLVNSMKQDFFRLKVFQIAGGAAQPNISGEQLDELPLLYPSDNLIEIYNNKTISIYKRIANNIKQNQQLTSLRDWLLPMLMNGQVTVHHFQTKTVEEKEEN